MITLIAMYPKTETSTMDVHYYLNTHAPMVVGHFGSSLLRATVTTGEDFGGPTPYSLVSLLEIMGDIPNFTNVQPVMYVGSVS